VSSIDKLNGVVIDRRYCHNFVQF